MAFRTLDHDMLSSLAEYADAQGGRIERWLMVPSSMPLSVLGYVIDRAFGLIPSPDTSSFLLPEDRFQAYAPDMASFLKLSGRLFFNPIQDDYLDAVASECALRRTFIMEPPYDLPHLSYETCQEIIEGYTTVINLSKIGRSIRALISLSVPPAARDEFLQLVSGQPAVLQCHHVTGDYSYILSVATHDMESLERLINRFQKIGQTSTQIILSSTSAHADLL